MKLSSHLLLCATLFLLTSLVSASPQPDAQNLQIVENRELDASQKFLQAEEDFLALKKKKRSKSKSKGSGTMLELVLVLFLGGTILLAIFICRKCGVCRKTDDEEHVNSHRSSGKSSHTSSFRSDKSCPNDDDY